ncbi:MAG: AmmeMemoRadiSam system radical SAM enzyme [Myxococcota bacterium]
MKLAKYFSKLDKNRVKCELCPFNCVIKPDEAGLCKVRQNNKGKLYTQTWGRLLSLSSDPIEKKPLYHVLPGESILSYATCGCNLDCHWCQNSDIAQWPRQHSTRPLPGTSMEPATIVEKARQSSLPMIAATYTEPTVFYEYSLEIAKLAKKNNIMNIWVSNGAINPEPLQELIPFLDAANIDLKGFDSKLTSKYTGLSYEHAAKTIEILHNNGVWVEITTLIVPGVNDDSAQLKDISSFAASLSPNIPIHFSRYFPVYKYHRLPTPVDKMIEAVNIAREQGLNFVYTGNIKLQNSDHTLCPSCGKIVIERNGYKAPELNIDEQGRCNFCQTKIPGIIIS